MPEDFYNTISKPSTTEFKDRGSRFIGYTFLINSVNDFKNYREQLKKEHPKANHYCFAYRLGLDGTNFRISDDGEPSGSAGKPILGQIDNRELTNVLIIVVRYFGGTLLGVPGLINAYKTTASLALQLTGITRKPLLVNYRLQFDYTLMNDVMQIIKQYDCVIVKQETQLFCLFEIAVPKNKLESVLHKLKDMHTIDIQSVIKT